MKQTAPVPVGAAVLVLGIAPRLGAGRQTPLAQLSVKFRFPSINVVIRRRASDRLGVDNGNGAAAIIKVRLEQDRQVVREVGKVDVWREQNRRWRAVNRRRV